MKKIKKKIVKKNIIITAIILVFVVIAAFISLRIDKEDDSQKHQLPLSDKQYRADEVIENNEEEAYIAGTVEQIHTENGRYIDVIQQTETERRRVRVRFQDVTSIQNTNSNISIDTSIEDAPTRISQIPDGVEVEILVLRYSSGEYIAEMINIVGDEVL